MTKYTYDFKHKIERDRERERKKERESEREKEREREREGERVCVRERAKTWPSTLLYIQQRCFRTLPASK